MEGGIEGRKDGSWFPSTMSLSFLVTFASSSAIPRSQISAGSMLKVRTRVSTMRPRISGCSALRCFAFVARICSLDLRQEPVAGRSEHEDEIDDEEKHEHEHEDEIDDEEEHEQEHEKEHEHEHENEHAGFRMEDGGWKMVD